MSIFQIESTKYLIINLNIINKWGESFSMSSPYSIIGKRTEWIL